MFVITENGLRSTTNMFVCLCRLTYSNHAFNN